VANETIPTSTSGTEHRPGPSMGRTMPGRSALVLFLAAIALNACVGAGGPSPTPAPSPTPGLPLQLDAQTFVSTAVLEAGRDRELVAGTRIRIRFDTGRLSVSAGCNTMGGRYQVNRGTLILLDPATTEIGCDPDRFAQDDWLFGLLGSTPGITLSGDELTIRAGQTVITLVDRQVAEPDLPLTGRIWTLESIISGDAASSVPVGVVASIAFTAAGRVEVSTGCNSGSGAAVVGNGSLRITDLAITKRACPGAAGAVETSVLGVLRAPQISFEIEASLLRLRADEGGLDFRP